MGQDWFVLLYLFIYLPVYSLFKHTLSSSDSIASNEYMIANNELEGILKKVVRSNMIYRKGISLERLKKSTNYSCRNNLSQGTILNWALPNTRERVIAYPTCQVLFEFMSEYNL
jgi:hypothetical protein